MSEPLHGAACEIGDLGNRAVEWITQHLSGAPVGVVGDKPALDAALAGSITDAGLGLDQAWQRFAEIVAPNNIGLDSDRFLAFIPLSPSVASVWMDTIVSAGSFPAESWLEGAGAVVAENQVIDLFCRTAGMPDSAAGCFMSGGSIGNLSALAVGRERSQGRRKVAIADTAHASVDNALHLLGLEPLIVPTGPDCRLTGEAVRETIGDRTDVGIVVATAGSTNAGVIDDLAGCADVAADVGAWFHVDGAYGLAALLLPELRDRFDGLERADSFIVDPHKWLFATGGSCLLAYRHPDLARQVHTQHGPYIDVLRTADDVFNPCDLGYQLTRRATGLPLWFAMALHGVDAHRDGIRRGIELANTMADALEANPTTQLIMRPELGVVLFRRDGWGGERWAKWAKDLLASGTAFVAPTTHKGETVGRLVFMHPTTPMSVLDEVMVSLTA